MPKMSIREAIWAMHLNPEVMEQFEKLFALPEKWISEEMKGVTLVRNGIDCGADLSAILEGKD
jgi:hypothetical protein